VTTETKPDDTAEKIRRVYGRGLFDGLRKAGIMNPEAFMNQEKAVAIEKGLSNIARKVLEFVPINEPAKLSQIVSDMGKTGSRPDYQIVNGCLSSLIKAGLVKEPMSGLYMRVYVKPKLVSVKTEKETEIPAPEPVAEPVPSSALDRLAQVSAKIKALAQTVTDLAREIDDVALEVHADIQNVNADHAKLSQLKNLLKSIQ
jgi:hypothetical protein